MAQNTPMTEAMYYLLLALLCPAHGYRLMQQVSEASGGRITMGAGTMYGLLSKLEKEGLIELQNQDERRKTYALTQEGKEALRAEYRRLRRLVSDGDAMEVDEL